MMFRERFHLYAGHGKEVPRNLDEDDFQGDFYQPGVAKHRALKIQYEYDWWVIIDSETNKRVESWAMSRIEAKARRVKRKALWGDEE